jgi:hypothetical protein
MNAEVRIFVERLAEALQVPVQGLCETKGHYFCLVRNGDNFETREVEVGSSNDTYMTIKANLKEGEVVVLNPRGFPDKLKLPEVLEEKPLPTKVRQPKAPRPEGKEKPKAPPPGNASESRPAASGGSS